MKNARSVSSILGGAISASRHAATILPKKLIRPGVLILLVGLCLSGHAQKGEWVWMGGSSTLTCTKGVCYAPGNYGTLGTAAAGNIPPSRDQASSWTDLSGNFWVFGGVGDVFNPSFILSPNNDYELDDLWEFDPSTNEWGWMGGAMPSCASGSECSGTYGVYGVLGVPATTNFPGSRYSASTWTDNSGNLWLFSGMIYPYDSGPNLNDLWEFDPSTNEWVWMAGSDTTGTCGTNFCTLYGVYGTPGVPAASNVPGPRQYAVSWTDTSGNLWMFGGWGAQLAPTGSFGNTGPLNDIWEFSPSTNEWTWMGGPSKMYCTGGYGGYCGQEPVDGVQGVPAAGNTPGGRYWAASWVDGSGNLWLYSGEGIDTAAGTPGVPDDLWELNTSTLEWTWIWGDNSFAGSAHNYYPPVYGALGVPAAENTPGGRVNAVTWVDQGGKFWLFGGEVSGNEEYGISNDLWMFDPSTEEWTWMGGSNLGGQPGVYGTLGTPAVGNVPGARQFAVSWTDKSGNLWLFGGRE